MKAGFDTITVMDYCSDEIRVYRNVETDDPEKWLQEHDEHWKENKCTCYYMYGNSTEVTEYDRGIIMKAGFDTITVMDYCFNEIRVYRNVETDDPEEWLEEHDEHWKESTCYYMYGDSTEVKEYEQ